MDETILCEVCGEPATRHFGSLIPLCDNPVCEVAMIEQINQDLRIASNEETEA